ncbi:microcompartment protein [Rhodospirillum rubrum]|uniref:BMC domain-containing protein n=1 Tax=Rhodospirillum rubrum TaxID=1085 RepID=UPI001906F06E|nr:BMC domain-containing protein [Rhodospirillum rubrum]MBK1664611.1 microcompartment protein [Rhodospirillum rubrum]MBK1677238.1 microcompartment protein [Rhodospirillum rubrum]
MAQLSLGLIETIGLAAAIEAADAAVKSANVALVGYEFARGDGMTVVKVQGDVGAVNAAIAAAAVAAARVGRVVSTRVIARPAAGIDGLIVNRDTVGVPPRVVSAPAAEPTGDASPSAATSSPAPIDTPLPQPVPTPQAPSAAATVDEVPTPPVMDETPAQPVVDETPAKPAVDETQTHGAERTAPSPSRQGKTGGRPPAGNNGKPRNRHDA